MGLDDARTMATTHNIQNLVSSIRISLRIQILHMCHKCWPVGPLWGWIGQEHVIAPWKVVIWLPASYTSHISPKVLLSTREGWLTESPTIHLGDDVDYDDYGGEATFGSCKRDSEATYICT
jgi:hypothetical protein